VAAFSANAGDGPMAKKEGGIQLRPHAFC
jgi:hypothetical protein